MVWGLVGAFLLGALYAMGRELKEHSMDNRWPLWWSDWWNRHDSWKRKWKIHTDPYHHWWYGCLKKTPYHERFAFSSTLLVWITDAEHLFQLVATVALLLLVWVAAGVGSAWVVVAAMLGMAFFNMCKEFILDEVQ